MAPRPALLCIHRDPARIRVLPKNGYKVLPDANAQEGLQLLASEPVDAVVLEYSLSRLHGSLIASEIKQLRPNMPIVMLAENAELSDAALESVDALVSTSDPPYFLWAVVHFTITVSRVANDQRGSVESQRKPGKSLRERGGDRGISRAVAETSTMDRTVQF